MELILYKRVNIHSTSVPPILMGTRVLLKGDPFSEKGDIKEALFKQKGDLTCLLALLMLETYIYHSKSVSQLK